MRAALLALFLVGCDSTPGRVFIALDSDFRPFETWERVALGSEPVPGHPMGPSFAYLNQRTTAKSYPLGTMVVKTFEVEPSWEIFAMAKRGGGFNPKGARDWEFFRLKRTEAGVPVIVSRGIFAFDPDSDGFAYGSPGVLDTLCNSCHGADAAASDHIIDERLWPGH